MSDSSISSVRWPRISIVTPSYNQGKFIERTVRSVLLQRYPDLEYIVMDGGSTDDTLDRLAPYMEQFACFVSEPDKGQADAIAKGFARSSGEIMAYLNSDDLLAPDALHFVASFFRDNPNIDWIYSHRCTVDDDDRVIRYWILLPHQNFLMRRWDYIPQETCFWRRSLFEKTGNIDRSYQFAMDYDLFVRFMNSGRGRRLNRFLAAFRDHSGSKTKQLLETVGTQEMLRVRRKFRISVAITDGLFGLVLGNAVLYAGRYFAATDYTLPGGFAGVGYDYNDVWGGLLRPDDLASADPDGSGQFDDEFFSPLCPVTLSLADRVLFTVTSVQGGHVKSNKIYLNSKSGVAIIAPRAEQENTGQLIDVSRNPPTNSRSSANAKEHLPRGVRGLAATALDAVCRLPLFARSINVPSEDRTADYILRLTRGFVSKDDKVVFLDVGCSRGELLGALAGPTRWTLFGLEADSAAAAQAVSKGYQVFEGTLAQAPGIPELLRGFDLIYLGNGLQRFGNPRLSLRTLAVLLNRGGFLVLSTPSLDSEQRELFGPAWAHWQPEEHRFIYSRKSLIKLLGQAGFSLMKLQTVSHLESTALSLKHLDDHSASDARYADHPKILGTEQAEGITRASRLLWDKIGRGDEIFAIFRRVS